SDLARHGLKLWLSKELKLEVNRAKSGAGPTEQSGLLGFRIDQEGTIAVGNKAIQRLRELWNALQGKTSEELRQQWQQHISGWWNYFQLAEDRREIERLSGWIRRHMRECFCHEGKVKHRTLANLTDWPKHILAGLRLLLKGHQPSATLSSESFRITRSLPHGHVEAVLRVVRTLGLDRLLGSKLSPERNLALAMIVARILDPGSKLATARSLDCQTLSSTLAQECHLEGSIHENELYAAMDWLVSRQARIENALAARHLEEGCL